MQPLQYQPGQIGPYSPRAQCPAVTVQNIATQNMILFGVLERGQIRVKMRFTAQIIGRSEVFRGLGESVKNLGERIGSSSSLSLWCI